MSNNSANRLIQVSDTHLSAHHAYTVPNWRATVDYIASQQPDLVVCTGDVVFDDPDIDDDHAFARSEIERIPAPWRIVPGNHDVGDAPPDPWQDQHTTSDRVDRYRRHFGHDWWVSDFGAWRLVGINSQLFSTGLDDEEAQWRFLRDALADRGRPIALFAHKTPCLSDLDEDTFANATIPPDARKRLAEIVRRSTVRLIASGHLHAHDAYASEGILYVWAPSTGMISNEDSRIWRNAIACNGIIEYTLTPSRVRFRLTEPPGTKPIDYSGIDPTIPRGSRFLPPLPHVE